MKMGLGEGKGNDRILSSFKMEMHVTLCYSYEIPRTGKLIVIKQLRGYYEVWHIGKGRINVQWLQSFY